MPLHTIYHHPSVFTTQDKKEMSSRITKAYTDAPISLPAFYVVVIFRPISEENFYVGHNSVKNFVRIVSSHLARDPGTPDQEAAIQERLQDAWAPYIKERGLDWENHIEHAPRVSAYALAMARTRY